MTVRRLIFILAAVLLLTVPVRAADAALPEELTEAAEESGALAGGASWLWETVRGAARDALRAGARNAALLTLAALICGAGEALAAGAGELPARYVPFCGVLSVAALATGDLRSLIGLGAETLEELSAFAKLLLPTLSAAMAAGGFVSTAGVWQVTTLLVCDLLTDAAERLLLPMVYCFIAAAAAGALLDEERLDLLAEGLGKLISGVLVAGTAAFTGYLSVAGVLTGSADRMAVKAAKLAVSGAIPVVGGVLSDAAEGVLAAAGTARSTVGVLGVFALLSLCIAPLLRLGAQFLLYKLAAFAAGLAGTKAVGQFLDRLGEAFALVFAMTAACATVLLVALLVATRMVTG